MNAIIIKYFFSSILVLLLNSSSGQSGIRFADNTKLYDSLVYGIHIFPGAWRPVFKTEQAALLQNITATYHCTVTEIKGIAAMPVAAYYKPRNRYRAPVLLTYLNTYPQDRADSYRLCPVSFLLLISDPKTHPK